MTKKKKKRKINENYLNNVQSKGSYHLQSSSETSPPKSLPSQASGRATKGRRSTSYSVGHARSERIRQLVHPKSTLSQFVDDLRALVHRYRGQTTRLGNTLNRKTKKKTN